MKLPIFSRKSKTPKHSENFIAIDIGSDFVKAILFEVEETATLKMIGFGKHYLNLKDVQAGVISNKDGVQEAIIAAINEALLNYTKEVKDCVFGVSGEMSIGFSTTVRVTRKNSTEDINEKEILEIKKKIEDVALLQAQREYSRLKGYNDIDLELINSDITIFKVDGFFVTEPIGFKGKVIETTLFTAFAPLNHLKLLQQLAAGIGLNLITVSSNMYALVKNLSKEEPTEFNGIIVDIGGDSTDIAVVFSGGILATRTISVGGRTFTRRIANLLDWSFSDAENKKLMYSDGKLSEEETHKVGGVIDETIDAWLAAVSLALLDIEGVKTFPSKLYLTGGASYMTGLDEMLEEEDWKKNIPMRQHLKVKRVTLNEVISVDGFEKQSEIVVPASLGIIGLILRENTNE